jgi:hypothetical protein
MTKRVITVRADTTIAEIADLLLNHEVPVARGRGGYGSSTTIQSAWRRSR